MGESWHTAAAWGDITEEGYSALTECDSTSTSTSTSRLSKPLSSAL